MVIPALYVVEFEGVAVFRLQFRVTVTYVGGVADFLERVELTAPRTADTARVVNLHLVVLRKRIAQEDAGEEGEVVLAEAWHIVARFAIAQRLSTYLPGLSPQASRIGEFTCAAAQSGIEGRDVVVVNESVVEVFQHR